MTGLCQKFLRPTAVKIQYNFAFVSCLIIRPFSYINFLLNWCHYSIVFQYYALGSLSSLWLSSLLFNDNIYIEFFPRRILQYPLFHVVQQIKGKLSELLCQTFFFSSQGFLYVVLRLSLGSVPAGSQTDFCKWSHSPYKLVQHYSGFLFPIRHLRRSTQM